MHEVGEYGNLLPFLLFFKFAPTIKQQTENKRTGILHSYKAISVSLIDNPSGLFVSPNILEQ